MVSVLNSTKNTTIAKAMTIKQIKAANVGKFKQVVLVYNVDAVIK
ncbi:hypothetical protein [Levilactobacillus spicheri]|nr:hypothetical protein [Levilactobacillus spicheri]